MDHDLSYNFPAKRSAVQKMASLREFFMNKNDVKTDTNLITAM